MAELIDENRHYRHQKIDMNYPVWKVAILGVGLGLLFWILFVLLHNLIFSSIQVAGNVATILTCTAGIVALVRMSMAQPLMVSVAVAATLWGLAGWVDGLEWSRALLWCVLLHALAFVLFSWLARINKIVVAMILMLGVIALTRIIVLL